MTRLPLQRRFPALRIPRTPLGRFPTPVQPLRLSDGRTLLIKRDDLSGAVLGGNKVRGLEWLLAEVKPGDHVLTVGPRGSTHGLATATYATRLGATVTVVRWNQEMNAAARVVDARLRAVARVIDARNVAAAYMAAGALRLLRPRWIPAGGASARALLGHVNAALELAEQVERGECAKPTSVVVPFGTGGSAAGLALGLVLAGLDIPIVAVRVVPRLLATRRRLLSLIASATRLLERLSGEPLMVAPPDITIEHRFYGGGYGRAIVTDAENETALRDAGVSLDDTYSRKTFAASVARHDALPLFWLTFDGRLLRTG